MGVELGWLCAEKGFNVAQALAIGQPRKGNGAILFGTTEVAHYTFAAITGHTADKRGPRGKIHQLRRQQLTSVGRRLQRRSLEQASQRLQIVTTQTQLLPRLDGCSERVSCSPDSSEINH
jgi:hypothetical protein